MLSILYVIIGLTLLVVGGEYLVRASVALSFRLKLSKMVIGLTVVSFATSAPELLVSLQAAMDGFSDISLGNVIGSNIANIGLVLGVTAMISPIGIDRDFYRFNWPVMMLFSLVLYYLLSQGNSLSRVDGVLLLGGLALYLVVLIRRARKQAMVEVEEVDDSLSKTTTFKIVVWLLIGGGALYGGSELLVKGAVDLAKTFGVNERIIAVTMIAIGTSVPELAASVIAAVKKEKAISLGNLIGSNIFNIASVLGLTAIVQPIAVMSAEVLSNDIFWMLGFAGILLPLSFFPTRLELGRVKGFLIVGAYAVFLALTFLN